ncbi:hypothetical protein D5S17_07260 [Pseudonocardiaceae bacterium YIM PH 21723]|nr:hypothetical protein D5S17_07260 [Pseudonocardiaceae bacterium YIM PH 21723]
MSFTQRDAAESGFGLVWLAGIVATLKGICFLRCPPPGSAQGWWCALVVVLLVGVPASMVRRGRREEDTRLWVTGLILGALGLLPLWLAIEELLR